MSLRKHIRDSGSPACWWAARFGITKGYLSEIMNGQKVPSLRVAVVIERETGGAIPAASWVPETRPDGACPVPGARAA